MSHEFWTPSVSNCFVNQKKAIHTTRMLLLSLGIAGEWWGMFHAEYQQVASYFFGKIEDLNVK